MSQWQPIETAPKDGQYFLAYAPGCGRLLMRCWSEQSSETFALEGPSWKNPEPTHWMPLPPAPEVSHVG